MIADQQWSTAQEDNEQNKMLLDVSEQILELTEEARDFTAAARSTGQHQETREGTDRPSE